MNGKTDMTLNEFIARAVSFFDKAEPVLAVPKDNPKLAELEGKLAEAGKTIEARDVTIKDLLAKLETAQTEANAKGTEVKVLQAKLEAEYKRTDDTLSAMGVPAKEIPVSHGASDDVISKLEAIDDPRARALFFAQNKVAIQAAWMKLRNQR